MSQYPRTTAFTGPYRYTDTVGSMSAFQPAPSRTVEHDFQEEDLEKSKPSKYLVSGTVIHFLTLVGVILLMLVVMTPVWDSVRLLYDSTYVYFLGRVLPTYVICFCVVVTLFFMFSMLLLERCGRRDKKTDQTFMYLFTSTITTLGLGLVLFSVPLQTNTKAAYNELMVDCRVGPRTEPLYAYYNVLLNMRVKPDCIKQESIEQCPDFEERAPYTGFLKQMELEYRCSGFCFNAANNSALTANYTMPLTAVLMQQEAGLKQQTGTEAAKVNLIEALERRTARKLGRSSHNQQRQDTQGIFMLSTDQTLSKTDGVPMWDQLPQGDGNTVNNMISTGWMNAYPPTLFTNANYKTSCEGAAARDLRFTAVESGNLMYMEGAALLVTSVIVGFLKIVSMCRTKKDLHPQQEMINADGEGQYSEYGGKAKKIVT